MTRIELMEMLTECAKLYAPGAVASVKRNRHMNDCVDEDISVVVAEALVVDFVNFVGYQQGLDWGLYTKDLAE